MFDQIVYKHLPEELVLNMINRSDTTLCISPVRPNMLHEWDYMYFIVGLMVTLLSSFRYDFF